MYRQSEKKLVKQRYVLRMSPQYGELQPTVVAGFPNPLPDTLHLLLVGLFVYTCVFGRVYAFFPGCVYLC